MFRPIRTVQISSLATSCIGQSLPTFWSHTEQSWMFAQLVAALKITYIALHRYCLYDKFERDCSQVMRNVNIHLVNFFVPFACTFILMAQFNTVIVQSFI